MSFSRAKSTRFNNQRLATRNETSKLTKLLDKPQKTNKWSPPKIGKTLIKPTNHHSLSQPPSTTIVNTKSPRPKSGGDEGRSENSLRHDLNLEHDTDTEFCSATLLLSTDKLSKIDESNNKENIIDRKIPVDTNKNSNSGIPLRIKSSQANTKTAQKSINTSLTKSISHSSNLSNSANRCGTPKSTTPIEGKSKILTDKRSLQTQFEVKKQKLDLMKKELLTRQKLVAETYQVLIQLKNKLEESGQKNVELEELKISDDYSFTTSTEQKSPEIDEKLLDQMKTSVKHIPSSLLEICRDLLSKRLALLETLENINNSSSTEVDFQQQIETYKMESLELENLLEEKFMEQEKRVEDLIAQWQLLFRCTGDASSVALEVEQLQAKLQHHEQKFASINLEFQHSLQHGEQLEKKNAQATAMLGELREKIKSLEHDLKNEKDLFHNQKEKNVGVDQKLKTMKNRITDLETKCKESDNKFSELQKSHKHAQDQLKQNEHRWQKEKEELVTKNKHDKQLLDKLTKDRSCFETRMKSLEECMEDAEKNNKNDVVKLQEDMEAARRMATEEKTKRDTIQQKYECLKQQLVEMEIRNKQAIDLVKSKNPYEPNEINEISTNREAELYTELLATRVALKAAEDQIQNYTREKLRFIDSIQFLQTDNTKEDESVATSLIKNVEKITELESKLRESDNIISNQNIKVSKLKVEIENLKQRLAVPTIENNNVIMEDNDLKTCYTKAV